MGLRCVQHCLHLIRSCKDLAAFRVLARLLSEKRGVDDGLFPESGLYYPDEVALILRCRPSRKSVCLSVLA